MRMPQTCTQERRTNNGAMLALRLVFFLRREEMFTGGNKKVKQKCLHVETGWAKKAV